MYDLKPLSREAIPAALEKAHRYRLLNEPLEAESICRDILAADPGHQEAALVGPAGEAPSLPGAGAPPPPPAPLPPPPPPRGGEGGARPGEGLWGGGAFPPPTPAAGGNTPRPYDKQTKLTTPSSPGRGE